MANCVECAAKIDKLIKKLPHNEYELSLCKECGLIADPYIEYELNLKVLHIFLCRAQVYRHFLYNYPYTSPNVHSSYLECEVDGRRRDLPDLQPAACSISFLALTESITDFASSALTIVHGEGL